MFVYFNNGRGIKNMTKNKKELLSIITENDKPEQAMMTAIAIVLNYLKQHESFEEQASVGLQGLDQISRVISSALR